MGMAGCLVTTLSDPCLDDINGLAVLNVSTGSWILRGTYKGPSGDPSSFNDVTAIAYDDVGARLIGEDLGLGFINIDPLTGLATLIAPTEVPYFGLTYGLADTPFTPGPNPIPEPATVFLGFTGILFLIAARLGVARRRKSRRTSGGDAALLTN